MSQINVKLPDAVQWAEGMLLTPQHFQQNDIQWNAVLQHRMRGVTAHHWGLRHLKIDMGQLASGTLAIEELACVFPDGTPWGMETEKSSVKPLAIKPTHGVDGKSFRICVAVPPRTGAMDVPTTSIKRYDSLAGENAVIDEMTGIADVYVDRIRPKVELYVEHEVPAGYHALPLVEVLRNAHNAQIEMTAFQAPTLRMGAFVGAAGSSGGSMGVLRALHQLRDQLWDKMHKLTGMAQTDGPERVSAMSPEERMQLGLARHIASSLPMFDAIMLDPDVPPVQAYHALAHVVGSMAWVGSNPAPLVMPPYAHDNCAPQFQAAIDFVSRKLALINTDWDSLAFSRVGELIFARRLPEDARNQIYVEVRLREGQRLQDVQEWLADARVGSEELMPLLRQRRMPGALCRLLSSAEVSTLGLRSDAIVVQIDNQRIEVPQQGMVDCFRPGRSLLIQSDSVQYMPTAVLLQHRRLAGGEGQGAGGTAQSVESGAVHA